MDRLRLLACVVAGAADELVCAKMRAHGAIDPELVALSRRVQAARATDEDNLVIRLAAMLHTDIATLHLAAPAESKGARPVSAPQRVRMELSDGRGKDIQPAAIHWELAEMCLEYIKPRGAKKPTPAADEMVRRWYRATAGWLQLHLEHDVDHMTKALGLFPTDPEMLFLAGSQRETFATVSIQNAIRTAGGSWAGFSVDIGSPHTELRRAETFFRGVVARVPDHAEARLRLGRTLGLLERHADAAEQLRLTVDALTEPHLQYYAHLFLGAEEEALRQFDAAQAEYERASELFPQAQSPYLAMSQLARRKGDRAGALRAAERLFALSTTPNEDREDPFWVYHLAQARGADDDLDAVRKSLSTLASSGERPQ